MKDKNESREEDEKDMSGCKNRKIIIDFMEKSRRSYVARKKEIEIERSRIEEIEEKIDESINNPVREERRKRRLNWQAHRDLLTISESFDDTSLIWSCSSHSNMSIDEALKLAKKNYESTFDENFEDKFNP